jgi:hypothetical protein
MQTWNRRLGAWLTVTGSTKEQWQRRHQHTAQEEFEVAVVGKRLDDEAFARRARQVEQRMRDTKSMNRRERDALYMGRRK